MLIFTTIFTFSSFLLYCLIANTTIYDRYIDDLAQEEFIRNRRKRKM